MKTPEQWSEEYPYPAPWIVAAIQADARREPEGELLRLKEDFKNLHQTFIYTEGSLKDTRNQALREAADECDIVGGRLGDAIAQADMVTRHCRVAILAKLTSDQKGGGK